MIPAQRQHVRVKGTDDVFLVISVERELGCAYVLPLHGPQELFWVPFDKIEPEHPAPTAVPDKPKKQNGDAVA